MARKSATVVIEAEGRDKGKSFLITEMSASRAEDWATRALLALTRSNPEIPDDMVAGGFAAVAQLGMRILAGLPYAEARPLMDDMMACVEFVPDPGRPAVKRALIEDDIEEVSTRLKLRDEVFSLHTGFSVGAVLSKVSAAAPSLIPAPAG